MKKPLIFLAVLVAVTIFPLAAYASNSPYERDQDIKSQRYQDERDQRDHQAPSLHDRMEQNRHEQTWKDHEQQWSRYDRQWQAHSGNKAWREKHAKTWSDWYKWHQENESKFHHNGSGDHFDLDIRH